MFTCLVRNLLSMLLLTGAFSSTSAEDVGHLPPLSRANVSQGSDVPTMSNEESLRQQPISRGVSAVLGRADARSAGPTT